MFKKVLSGIVILCACCGVFVFTNQEKAKTIIKDVPVINKIAYKTTSILGMTNEQPVGMTFEKEVKKSVNLIIDASTELGDYKNFYCGVGMGSFNDGALLPQNRRYYQMLQETNKEKETFIYVNTKGILSSKADKGHRDDGGYILSKNDNGKLTYNWFYVDAVLDKFMESGLKPILSLTFMPEVLATNPGRRNPWHRGIITPPNDYKKWQELIYRTILHLKERYGQEEISTWYFEVWNEPDLYKWFWIAHPDKKRYPHKGDNEEYYKLYDYAVQGAIQAEPGIKIGGPAIAGELKLFFRDFLKHCYSGKNYATGEIGTRLDFISRHHYGSVEEEILPHYKQFIDIAREEAGNKFEELDILITETGPSAFPKPWMNNHYVAAWIVKEFDAMFYLHDNFEAGYLPDIMCFWTKPVPLHFGNHFGVATVLGDKWRPDPETIVKRPSFNGYYALSLLGKTRLKIDGAQFGDFIHGIATKEGDKKLATIIYHFNQWDINSADTSVFNVNILFRNISFPNFKMDHYRIDKEHSNGFTAWKTLGSPQEPNNEEIKELQQRDDLEILESGIKNAESDGSFSMNIKLPSNGVSLIMFTKI